MKRAIGIVAAVMVVAGLAACSDNNEGGNAPPSPQPSPTGSTSAASSPVQSATASWDCIKHWDDQHCGQQANAPKPTEVPAFQVFNYQSDYYDLKGGHHVGTEWQVNLISAECGLKRIAKADENENFNGPRYVVAKPDPGNEFCLLTWHWMNVGKKPEEIHPAGQIMVGDEAYEKSSEDQVRSTTVTVTHLKGEPYEKINPHGETDTADVYQVPAGQKATQVLFPEADAVEPSRFLVDLN